MSIESELDGVENVSPQLDTNEIIVDHEDAVANEPNEEGYNYWHLPGESPELYERVGIKFFKKWLPTSGDKVWQLFKDKSQLVGDTRRDQVQNLIKETKLNESIHLGLTLGYGGLQYITTENTPYNKVVITAAWAATQIGMNVYPIMLQRYNRLRAQRVLGRLSIK